MSKQDMVEDKIEEQTLVVVELWLDIQMDKLELDMVLDILVVLLLRFVGNQLDMKEVHMVVGTFERFAVE